MSDEPPPDPVRPAPEALRRVMAWLFLAALLVQVALLTLSMPRASDEVPLWGAGAGLVLWAALTPVLVRLLTTPAAGGRGRVSGMDWLLVAAAAVGLAMLLGLATLVAFVAVCVPIGMFTFSLNSPTGGTYFWVALVAGLAAAALVLGAGAYAAVRALTATRP